MTIWRPGGDDPGWFGVTRVLLVAFALLAVSTGPGWADGGGGGGGGGGSLPAGPPEDPAYRQAVQAIERGDYPRAVGLLRDVVRRQPSNPDAWNWLAYATRQGGRAAEAIPLYQKALAIDPDHRGAHEYIGEAYLVLGDLASAREHLARLDKLCFFPCSEYRDLKKAVEAYERTGGQVRPGSRSGS